MRLLSALAFVTIVPSLLAAQSRRPPGWVVRTDAAGDSIGEHSLMPPGWHITTNSPAVLYDPANQAKGRYAVEAEIHLFPGESTEGFGLLLGGAGLDANPSWTAFLISRNGNAMVERRHNGATTVLLSPTRAPSVKPHTGGEGTALNIIRVLVQGDSAIFSANGQRIAAVASQGLGLDGTFGFRVGRDLNLHVTNLDLVTRLAPYPNRR